ncbi:MAG: hypothetical protein K8E66_00645 [Phycisphaerales bacterium]|nr:hypothetical protein [Phycisphaerales bacterium]
MDTAHRQLGHNERIRLWIAAMLAHSDRANPRSPAEHTGPLDRLLRDVTTPDAGVTVCPPDSPVVARIGAR